MAAVGEAGIAAGADAATSVGPAAKEVADAEGVKATAVRLVEGRLMLMGSLEWTQHCDCSHTLSVWNTASRLAM